MHTKNRPQFTEEHNLFRDTVRKYVSRELRPHQKEWETSRKVPREVFSQLAKQGFFGITFPEKVGGLNCDYWYKVIFAEEMLGCRMNGFVMDVLVHSDMTSPVLLKLGTEEQIQEILIPAVKGEKILALGITEPGAGSDVAHITTTAVKDGNDYIIKGAKTFITNGNRADFIILAVRTGGALCPENWKKAHEGISFILFPTKTPGFSTGRKLDKLGNWSSDTAELSFQNCRVPARYLLGQENRGFYYIMHNFQGERLIASVMSVASMRQMWNDALEYGKQREAFGRPLINFQVWKHRFAQMATEIEAAEELTYRACDLFNRGIPCNKEISMSKLFSTELANRVAYACGQIHGGSGYMEEYDIARQFRDLRLLTIGAGTSEIMREIIAKECGL
jgi:citronellyl-CoA dehydrogenase